jgi:hypothetical protein
VQMGAGGDLEELMHTVAALALRGTCQEKKGRSCSGSSCNFAFTTKIVVPLTLLTVPRCTHVQDR